MTASNDTIRQVIEVVGRYVDRPTLIKILDDLVKVPGNQSFRETVVRIRNSLKDSG